MKLEGEGGPKFFTGRQVGAGGEGTIILYSAFQEWNLGTGTGIRYSEAPGVELGGASIPYSAADIIEKKVHTF
jgi:hypothetical protein